jgi:hypothetical protein
MRILLGPKKFLLALVGVKHFLGYKVQRYNTATSITRCEPSIKQILRIALGEPLQRE